MTEEDLKEAKKTRTNAKAALTRSGNWLNSLVEVKRPASEVRDALDNVEKAYNHLVIKHEDYTKCIDDDTEFDEAEGWMEDCQSYFINYIMRGKEYLESLVSQEKKTLENGADNGTENEKTASNQPNIAGIPTMQTGVDRVSGGSLHDNEQILNNNGQENNPATANNGDNESVNENLQVPNSGLNDPSPPSKLAVLKWKSQNCQSSLET